MGKKLGNYFIEKLEGGGNKNIAPGVLLYEIGNASASWFVLVGVGGHAG